MSKTNKRSVVLVAAGILLLLGLWRVSPAHAETAKTTKNTRVMQRPAERSMVVTRVGSGKVVKVLSRNGKWVKIRVNGRTGWVARASLTANVNARGSVNKERRRPFVKGRSKKRNFEGSAPKDLVGADAVDPDMLEEEEPDEAEDEDEDAGDDEGDEQEAAPPDEEVLEDEDTGDAPKRVAAREPSASKSRSKTDDQEEMAEDDEQDDLVRVAAATTLRVEPSAKSKAVVDASAGAKLTVLEKADGWLFVENADGDQGWIRTDDVTAGGALSSYEYPNLLIRAGGRANMAMVRNRYEYGIQGEAEVQSANIGNDTISLITGGEVLFKLKPAIMLRGDLSYTGVLGKLLDNQNPPKSISYTTHELNLGAGAGYNFQDTRGMLVYGRVGFHYTFLRAAPVNNTLKLPSESLLGATLGSGVELPRLFDKIGMRASTDVLLPFVTSRTQTDQLNDGEKMTLAWALWLSLVGSYQLQPTLHVEASYRFYRGKTNWVGDSQRFVGMQLNSTSRTDINHLLGVGVSKLF